MVLLTKNAKPVRLNGHRGRIDSVTIATESNVFATGSYRPQSTEGEVRIWALSTGELLHRIQTDFNGIFSLASSHDGQYLAVGGGGVVIGQQWQYTNGIEVWSLENRKRLARFGEELFFVKSLAFSPDDRFLLCRN